MDATICASVFHMQNKHYDGCRPPNFFDHDYLNKLNLTRARTRHNQNNKIIVPDENKQLKSVYDCEKEITGTFVRSRSNPYSNYNNDDDISVGSARSADKLRKLFSPPSPHKFAPPSPRRKSNALPGSGARDGKWDAIPPTPDVASSEMLRRTRLNAERFPASQHINQNFGCRPEGKTPPLFLQELAHLSSLAAAVALSTLRNDTEKYESPLGIYKPGSPWPEVDPDQLPKDIRNEFQHPIRLVTIIRHWIGRDRLPFSRSKYNAARPLHVLGGVSDAEILQLQMARGAHAKTQLAMAWLGELITREHLDGGMGTVHAAIVSRLIQCLSDGMLLYHQARKIMYIPMPFTHAQLSAFFTLVMIFAVPFMIDQYTNMLWMGSIMTFMTVTCLVGLHEVARELENPFRNVPNEIPLCTLHALYNEALVTMFAGYNPDSFWDPEMHRKLPGTVAIGKGYQQQHTEESKEEIWEENAESKLEAVSKKSSKTKALEIESNNITKQSGRRHLPKTRTLRDIVLRRKGTPKSESLLESQQTQFM